LESVGIYEPDAARLMGKRITVDYAIQVALQKTLDIPFVPPLDIEQDAETVEAGMKRRYWTVFEPRILEAVRRGGGAGALIAQEGELQEMENTDAAVGGRRSLVSDLSQKDISHEIRSALNVKIASASNEIRIAMARALAESEESIRRAIDRTVSDSEEAVRNATKRTVSDSEEALRAAVANSEAAILAAVTAELRQATVRIPGRRFVSLVGAVSAVIAAALIAIIYVVAQLLHF
jgi:hypothetical protein